MTENPELSALEIFTARIKRYIDREKLSLFGLAFVAAMLVHLYMFTNKLANHDDVMGLYDNCAFGLMSARWFLKIARIVTGPFSSSYLNGLIGSACLAGTAVIIIDTLRLKTRFTRLAAVLLIVSFPGLASIYVYTFTSAPYFLSLLLAAIAVPLIKKRKAVYSVLAAVLLALSLGIYQAYFALAAALLVISLILEVCNGEYESFKELIRACFAYLLPLAAGMALYFVILKLCVAVTGVQLVYEAGAVSAGELVKRIFDAYRYFIAYYCCRWIMLFPKWFILVSAVCVMADAWIVFRGIRDGKLTKKPLMLASLLVLAAILPLACNLSMVMSGVDMVHQLMIFPLVLPFVLALNTLERIPAAPKKRLASFSAALIIAAVTLCGYLSVMTVNETYFTHDMINRNLEAFYERVLTKVEMLEGFTPDTPIAIAGGFSVKENIPDTDFTGVASLERILNMYSKFEYCRYFLCAQYDFLGYDEMDFLGESETYHQMPAYPADGSIQMIDGVAVVRLG